MKLFCKHNYGEPILGRKLSVEWGLSGDLEKMKIRVFQRCRKCKKEKVLNHSEIFLSQSEFDEFAKEYYMYGTGIIKPQYSSKANTKTNEVENEE